LSNRANCKNSLSSDESKKPAGRRERRSLETRENLFRNALQLFAERGFSATTIEAITEAADVGKGTFFNYFDNKESILLEFREMQMGRIRAFVSNSIKSDEPLTTLIYKLAVTMTEEQQKSPVMFQSLITAIFSNDAVQKRMSEGLNTGRQMLAELISHRQRSGEIRRDISPDEIAHSFQRMIFGTTLIWSVSPDTTLEENLKKMADIFVYGIQSRHYGSN
jgi:AcrR family transcriptional regulator